MKIDFGYGKETQTVSIPDSNLRDVLMSNPIEHERRGSEAVRWALDNPIDSAPLCELVKPGMRIIIITSDISRPMPSFDVLPHVLDELYKAGCRPEDISVVLARGSHRHHTEDEMRHLVGERCFSEVSVYDSDTENCVHIGTTSAGTDVDIDRRVAEADFRICLGNIEFHYFAGYSGGYKAIMPGVSTPSAIQTNHRMMLSDDACAGKMTGNPIREDIDEAGEMLGVNFIVNVVLDEHKQIVYAAAGHPRNAHRKGCEYLDRMYRRTISEKADIVIVSQGGAPKDANLYQTQKALDNSKHAVRDGGTIILIGACSEGLGNPVFEEWITSADKPSDLTDRIRREFRLGGHKAAAIAMVLARADIYLVSHMDDAFVESIFMKPAANAQAALDTALAKYGPDASVIAMPFGGSVLPTIRK